MKLAIAFRAFCLALLVLALPLSANAQESEPLEKTSEKALSFIDNLMEDERWVGARNLIGAAKGVAIITDVKKAAFIVGYETGNGVMLARHGEEWSDPLSIQMSATSVAFQAGAQDANVIMVFLTRKALNDLAQGIFKLGGSGGFALADWGASGRAGGSISGGIEVLTLSISKGLFAGGGVEGMKLSLNTEANEQAYGTVGAEVLNMPGGKVEGAKGLRASLTKALKQSWYE